MPKMIDDKQMKRGDCEFLFSGNTMAYKWMDNLSVPLLSSALEGMNDILSVDILYVELICRILSHIV